MNVALGRSSCAFLASFAIVAALTACATQPPPRPARQVQRPAPPPPPPDTTVYSYPTRGQSADRHDRDRYECHLWAVKQSGFDPSGPSVSPRQRVRVVADPPAGSSTAAGAIAGAAVGAAVAHPYETAEGAIVGAVVGGAIGASADAARERRARRIESELNARESRQAALFEQKASGYRRAISACLEGRGYNVR